MSSIVSADPFRCRMWSLHDRLQKHVSEDNCREEIHSFKEYGQLVPVLGRTLQGDPGADIELIYGARRLFVARHIKTALLVELRELSDREAIIAMDVENRQRQDLSPYERGLSYARWLRAGYFRSQHDLARALGLSASQVSRLLKLARLPSVIVEAFGSAVDIHEGWGSDLVDAIEDPARRTAAIRTARTINAAFPRPAASEVYRQLLASSARGRKLKALAHDQVVNGEDGTPLFRVRHQRNSIALVLPHEKVSHRCLEAIEDAVARIMDRPDGAATYSSTAPRLSTDTGPMLRVRA